MVEGPKSGRSARVGQIALMHVMIGKEGYWTGVRALSFHLEGARPVISVASGRMVSTWDAVSGQSLRAFTAAAPVSKIAFNSDGSRLATMEAGRVSIRDVASLKELWTVAHAGPPTARLLFTPTGDRLIAISRRGAASPDTQVPEVSMWEASSGTPVQNPPDSRVFALSKDGKRIAVAGGAGFGVEDRIGQGNSLKIAGRDEKLRSGAFSADSKMLATAGDNWGVVIWDVASRRPLQTLAPVRARTVAWSRDQKLLSTSSYVDEPKVWDVNSGRLLNTLRSAHRPVLGLAFSPDHAIGATAGGDGSAQLWDLRDAAGLRKFILAFPFAMLAACTRSLSVPTAGTWRSGAPT